MNRPSPAPRQYFGMNGSRMAYLTAGNPQKPAVVLIHGWMSHAEVWRQTLDVLQADYYCIAVDLLGLSVSDKPTDGDYTVPAHAQRILALLDSLKIREFTLIGHSFGGQISLYIAAIAAPERVTRLIDVAGVVTGELAPYVERIIMPRMALAVPLRFLWNVVEFGIDRFPAYAKLEFRTWFYDINAIDYGSWALDRDLAFHPSMYISVYRIGQAIRAMDLTPHLSKIRTLTLIIFGDHDGVVPNVQGKLAHECISGSELLMLPECGHFPMYEQTPAYLKAIKRVLAIS